MAPFAKSNFRLKDNLATLVALKNGLYDVDVNNIIDKMSRRVSKIATPLACGVPENATLADIRGLMVNSQTQILLMMDDIEREAIDAENYGAAMSDIANNAKWRLRFNAVATSAFAALGIASLVIRRKYAGFVAVVAALAFAFSFLSELDLCATELNEQHDALREICDLLATDIVGFAMRRSNHNYFYDRMKDRFGDNLTEEEVDEDALSETYGECE